MSAKDPPGTAYICESPGGEEKLVVTVSLHDFRRHDAREVAEDIVKGFRKGNAAKGGTASEFTLEPTNDPFPGSYRFEGAVTLVEVGQQLHVHGYVFLADRSYMFLAYSIDPSVPESLRKFVRSFRLLHPVAAKGPLPAPLSWFVAPTAHDGRPYAPLGLLYLGVTVLFAAATPLIRRVVRPPFANPGTLAGAVILLCIAVRVVAGAVQGSTAEEIGFFIGQGLWGGIASLALARHFRDRRGPPS